MSTSAASPSSSSPRWKRWLKILAILFVVGSLLGSTFVGVAEYHTAQPEFCASCHNMVPYYESWEADLHGKKLEVACVECHYAPGERTTIKAKLRGLSQLASYFGGRESVTRPRAFVADASCLTSKCHGDLEFMDKKLELGKIEFTHANHLQRPDTEEEDREQKLSELRNALQEQVGAEHIEELVAAANQSLPAAERLKEMQRLVRDWNVDIERQALEEFSSLAHRGLRLAQLKDLQCTNCHVYASPTPGQDGKAEHHFRVTMTSCFTCHFNNEGFNVGTNRCQLCHELPTQEIVVHEPLTGTDKEELNVPELAEKTIRMNHAEIIERKVECFACHADVIRNDATVTRRDCEACHDQARFFEEWQQPLSIDMVAKYHDMHIERQRAKCLDCHQEIKHQLVETDEDPTEFLMASVSNCLHCHPNHHSEQIKLLMGSGGVGVAESAPNPMFGSRTNCYGCHTEESLNMEVGRVIRATQKTCVACHGDRYADMFEQWKMGVELTLQDAESTYLEAKQQIEENTDASPAQRAKAEELLAIAEKDLRLVKLGNGIHNVTYSIELLDSVVGHSQRAMEALTAEEDAE